MSEYCSMQKKKKKKLQDNWTSWQDAHVLENVRTSWQDTQMLEHHDRILKSYRRPKHYDRMSTCQSPVCLTITERMAYHIFTDRLLVLHAQSTHCITNHLTAVRYLCALLNNSNSGCCWATQKIQWILLVKILQYNRGQAITQLKHGLITTLHITHNSSRHTITRAHHYVSIMVWSCTNNECIRLRLSISHNQRLN